MRVCVKVSVRLTRKALMIEKKVHIIDDVDLRAYCFLIIAFIEYERSGLTFLPHVKTNSFLISALPETLI